MNVAVIGAAGGCGRQLAVQLLDRHILPQSARLQLVGHRGGRSEDELWGLLSDLEDAFGDSAPTIDLVVDPQAVDADVVVMLAGSGSFRRRWRWQGSGWGYTAWLGRRWCYR